MDNKNGLTITIVFKGESLNYGEGIGNISELKKLIQQLEDLDYKYKIGLIDLNIGLEAIICTI